MLLHIQGAMQDHSKRMRSGTPTNGKTDHATAPFGADSVLQFIVMPKEGSVEDVVVQRVYMTTLPVVVQLAIEAYFLASESPEDDTGIVIPCDLVTISGDLYDRILKDTRARDEIMEPCAEADTADDAVDEFGRAWQSLFFGATPEIVALGIRGVSDPVTLTVRIETPREGVF